MRSPIDAATRASSRSSFARWQSSGNRRCFRSQITWWARDDRGNHLRGTEPGTAALASR